MTLLISPAPYGAPGLAFGDTSTPPYKPGYPHAGQDHEWFRARPVESRRTVAGASGTVITAYNDGGYHLGWGNYVDILIPSTTHRIVLRLAHHETGTVVASRGAQIAAGSPVGRMGNTGKALGIHLHEGLLIDGVWHDPVYYRTHDLPGTPSTAGGDAKPFVPTSPEEDDMPHFHDPTQRIYWPNGYYNTYGQGVYGALKAYFKDGTIVPGTEGTVEREVWLANDFMAAREAAAVAKGVTLTATVDLDAEQIAAAVVKALPKQQALPTAAQIAKAVNDDAAKRLAS